MLSTLLFTVAGYLSGSVLYSKLIAQRVLSVDLATVGDGNPGMTNVARAGGVRWAALAFLLDCCKAAVPVGLAYYVFGIQDWRVIPIALAPPVGHAYPIFFNFQGGKAIASVAGSWVGIAILEIIVVSALLLVYWNTSVRESAWVTMFTLWSVLVYLLWTEAPTVWLTFMLVCIGFLAFTHRHGLHNPPGVKPWVQQVAAIWH
jgi:acyl phosphate:glycerol-3-phosphate acyltransferase